MQLMAYNIDEVKSSQSRNLYPVYSLIDNHSYRESVASRPPKVVLVSGSINKSCHLVRRSARGNRRVVLPKQSFRRVEVHRFPAMDPREAYVIQSFPVPLSNATCPYSGLREERPLVRCFSCVFDYDILNCLAAPQ